MEPKVEENEDEGGDDESDVTVQDSLDFIEKDGVGDELSPEA